MHSHHEGPLFEPTSDPKERYDYIVSYKTRSELELRLALFARVDDDVLETYIRPGKMAEYDKARAELNKACAEWAKEYDRAHAELNKARAAWWDKARAEYDRAHAEYDKARAELNKACAEYDKAHAELDKASAECIDLERMHQDLCWPWCPGESIFAKGTSLDALVVGVAWSGD